MASPRGHIVIAPGRTPRVTYWTGWLSPEMEGCSREVFALTDHFPRSRVFGLSRHYGIKVSRRRRYIGFHVRLYALFRLLAPLWDATSEINHIYGSLNEWFFLRALRRRPIMLTVATSAEPLDRDAYAHVRRFVTHSDQTTKQLVALGFPPDRISLLYPGVELGLFRPVPRVDSMPLPGPWPASERFRVVFATTPNWKEGLRIRGVQLIVDAARHLPDVDFYLLWRPWAGAEQLIADIRATAPSNVRISLGLVPDMAAVYQAADATIAPFVSQEGTKICPTSLIESLACGRPLLVSSEVGISDLIRSEECGVVFAPTVGGLCDGVRELQRRHTLYAANARPCAERHFDLTMCCQQHEDLYAEVLRPC